MTIQKTIALVGLLAFALIKAQAAVAAAGPIPVFDTGPTCADAATEISVTRTVELCKQSEQQARDTLASQWADFPTADKNDCVATTKIGGFPSYVQVLTCLELARDARSLKLD